MNIRTLLLTAALFGSTALACDKASEEKRDVAAEEVAAVEAPASDERSFFAPRTLEDINALAAFTSEDFSN